ncbi:hypothetical protein VTO42DRAFT_5390 [Malbranchea cinnamomea]
MELEEFYKAEGIQMELTTPDTPQSNGQAERSNQIIIECEKPEILKKLVDGDLTGLLEPSYLATEREILEDEEPPTPDDALILSTLTDRPTILAEAKRFPDWHY